MTSGGPLGARGFFFSIERAWFIFGFVCALLPLLWPPARQLEYEYALLTAWMLVALATVLPPLAPDLIARYFQPVSFPGIVALNAGLLIPGIFLFASGQCACGREGFLFWMVTQAFVAGLIACAILSYSVRCSARRYTPILVVTTVTIVTLAGLWFFPQKRVTSVFLGFLHGPVYDRWIGVDAGVALARLSHGMAAVAILLACRGRSKALTLITANTAAVLWIGSFYWGSNGLGQWFIERELSSTVVFRNAEIHFERRAQRDSDLAESLVRDAAFHIDEIAKSLDVTITRPIKIYAYRNQTRKKLLFGGGNTDVTDVWTPTIHVELKGSPHPTLRHEIVHAVASFASWHGIGFHPNMVLTEGLAMALAPTGDPLSLDEISDGLLSSGRIQDVKNLWSPLGFWRESGSRSYAASGSLTRFLLARFGSRVVAGIYQGESIESATGQSSDEIISAWSAFVRGSLAANKVAVAEKMTRDPGVFSEVCPHTLADLSQSRSTGLWTRLRQPLFWNPDDVLKWRMEHDPGDTEAKMELALTQIRFLMTQEKVNKTGVDTWVEALSKSYRWPPEVIEDVEARLLRDDLLVVGNDQGDPASLTEIGAFIKKKSPGPQVTRQWEARQALRDHLPAERVLGWRRYLAGWGAMPPREDQEPWINTYLRARREIVPRLELVRQWEGLLGLSQSSPEIHKQWTSMIATGLMEHGQYRDAARYYESLARLSSGEASLLAREHGRRADYFERVLADSRPMMK